ncbi:MAG TPA: transposase [Armatimonadota bacterium]|nr:transposase [Armatimonadota bacterium]
MRGRDVLRTFERRQRHLPHWEQPGSVYAVRFSVRRGCPVDLTDPRIGRIVVTSLRHYDGVRYGLYVFTVMPDHVHAVLRPTPRDGEVEYLWRILGSIKSWTARSINSVLGRRGPVWRDESHDRIIRDLDEYQRWIDYIYMNPVAAELVRDPAQWPWSGVGRCG